LKKKKRKKKEEGWLLATPGQREKENKKKLWVLATPRPPGLGVAEPSMWPLGLEFLKPSKMEVPKHPHSGQTRWLIHLLLSFILKKKIIIFN
jgi:hypothetical protein